MGGKSQWAVRPLKCPEEDRTVDLLVEWKIEKGKKSPAQRLLQSSRPGRLQRERMPVGLCSKAFRQEEVTPCAGSYSKRPHAPDSSAGGQTLRTSPGDRLFVRRSQDPQAFPRRVRREPRRAVAFLSPSSPLRRFRSGHLDEARLEKSCGPFGRDPESFRLFLSSPIHKGRFGTWTGFLRKWGERRRPGWDWPIISIGSFRRQDRRTCSGRPRSRRKTPSTLFIKPGSWEWVEKSESGTGRAFVEFPDPGDPGLRPDGLSEKEISQSQDFSRGRIGYFLGSGGQPAELVLGVGG